MGNGKLEMLNMVELIDKLYHRTGCMNIRVNAVYDLDAPKKMNKTAMVDPKDDRFPDFIKKDGSLTIKDGKKKVNNPHLGKGLRKVAETVVMVSFDYDASVQRRTDGEEEAKKNGKCWMQTILNENGKPSPLFVHKDDVNEDGTYKENARFYLRGEFVGSESKILDREGNEVDKALVNPFFTPKKETTVNMHAVMLNNLNRIKFDGQEYGIYTGQPLTGIANILPPVQKPTTE